MYQEEKKEVLKYALKMVKYGIVKLSGGNLTVRSRPNRNHLIITPSGLDYEDIDENDMVVIDIKGNIIEGSKKPSVDFSAVQFILGKLPHINAVIHTHQVYATAVSLISDKIPPIVTTLANVIGSEVPIAPYSPSASSDMGKATVKYIGDKKAVILKHHGVVTIGESLKDAVYSAVYLEDAAQIYLIAKAIREPDILNKAQTVESIKKWDTYGQNPKEEN